MSDAELLLEVFDTEEAARDRMHDYAATLKYCGDTQRYGIYVDRTVPQGPTSWGVYLHDREG